MQRNLVNFKKKKKFFFFFAFLKALQLLFDLIFNRMIGDDSKKKWNFFQ